jgi:hypothetical protein
VKRPVPRSRRTEPKTPWGIPAAKAARASRETHEVRAHAVSFGWQISVGRIARLSHREVARPVGVRRALARKKLVAPPDAERGRTEGEPVRVCGASKQVVPCAACGSQACRVLDTIEGVPGLMPVLLSPAGRSEGPLACRSTPPLRSARIAKSGQHIGRFGYRLGCACGRRRERQRSTRPGEGSSRSEKVHGESASSTPEMASVQRCAGS